MAAAALAIVAVVTLIGIVGPAIASVVQCGRQCELGLGDPLSILRFATPFVAIALVGGLLIRPVAFVRPAALLSGLLAIGWIGPVAVDSTSTFPPVVALWLLSSSPFLLVTPFGPRASRWARWSWVGTVVAALVLWQVDEFGSRFMQMSPVPPQLAFLGMAAMVLGAGLASDAAGRIEGSHRTRP